MYHAIAELLGGPPTARRLAHVQSILGDAGRDARAGSSIRDALEIGAHETAPPWEDLPFPVCAGEKSPSRTEAFHSLGRADDTHPIAEALVLSSLADRTARAIRRGDLGEAAALCALQHRFSSEHARSCLGELARSLIRSGSAYFARVGRALDELTADDLALLQHR